jgi:PAS domain S-box-containing protein
MTTRNDAWPLGDGEMAHRIRQHGWAATPLGPIDDWTECLRSAVNHCLGLQFPAALLWGSSLVLLHNDAHIPILGNAFPSALGRPAADALRDSWPALRDHVMHVLSTGNGMVVPDLVAQLVRDETPRTAHFAVSFGPVAGERDERAGVLITCIETTEQIGAIQALRQSEERFRTLVQNLPDYAIFLLDAGGRVVEWSEGAERITGFSTEEAVGQHVELIYPEEAVRAGEPARELAEAARTGRVEREGWLARKGGERFWSNEIATAICDETGTLVGFTKISRDLSERREATAALRASEERGRAILEEATDYAIFTADASGRIEDWFPGAVAVFGWSAVEAKGLPYAATFIPEDRSAGVPEREFQTARQQGSAPDVRWHQHKNGTQVFIEGVVRARYDLDGEFLGVLKIGRDATEQRLAELEQAEVEERRRLELEARVISATGELRTLSRRLLTVQEEERRFLARELHDEIGQILTGLALTLSAGAPASQLDEAQRIVGELTAKVRQLSMDLRPAALDAYGLLPAIRSHLQQYEKRTGIMIELRADGLDRRFPAPVEITAYRVVQEALTNLARYARTSSGMVQLIVDDETLFVSVRDDGSGFDPAKITQGTGIGGMRERVQLLGGHFEVEAVPGQGTGITAELPLLPATQESAVELGRDETPA